MMPTKSIRVVVARGYQVTPWELRAWQELPERFNVGVLSSKSNHFDAGGLSLERLPVRTVRDYLPRHGLFDHVAGVVGERYLGAGARLAGADIVHAAELSYWFAAEAARHKRRHGYKLVQTVWETIPFMQAFRNHHARAYRKAVLAETDLFLPTTQRAAEALRIEGVSEERMTVCPPGIDTGRFAVSEGDRVAEAGQHRIVSAGRLVWEKGHQDVMRAVAALRRRLVPMEAGVEAPRLLIVGRGPEERRLASYAHDLGISDLVELRPMVPYDDMPRLYAGSSCMVLASLATAGCMLHPSDIPRCFWEEQFGLVLAEAMAAGLPIVASSSGAIPEVCGDSATYFLPGHWMELAHRLAEGPLRRPPRERTEHPADRVRTYSTEAMSERLTAIYDSVMA